MSDGSVERDRCVRVIAAGVGAANCVDWSSDATRLVIGGDAGISVRTVVGREVWRREVADEDGSTFLVAWSPDGRWIATGHERGSVLVRSAEDGAVAWRQGLRNQICDLGWSPKGARLAAVATFAEIVVVWQGRTGHELRRLSRADKWGPGGVGWSPDGKRLATGSGWGKMPKVVCVWGEGDVPLVEAHGHTGEVGWVRWSPEGRRLASASGDSTARIWDAATGAELVRTEAGDDVKLRGVAWSPDGRCIAAANWSNAATAGAAHHARVWDAATGKLVALLRGHSKTAFCVTFAPEGGLLATASLDGRVRLWDVSDLVERSRARREPQSRGLADYVARQAITVGRVAVSPAQEPLPRWEGADGKRLADWRSDSSSGKAGAVAFSQDGTCLFVGGADGTLTCRRLSTGEVVWSNPGAHSAEIRELALSPDGRSLASINWVSGGGVEVDGRGDSALWDAATGRLLRRSRARGLTTVCWSPDGSTVVTDEVVWNAATGEEQFRLVGIQATWLRGQRWTVSAPLNGLLHVFDAASRSPLRDVAHDVGSVHYIDSSPDGESVAVSGAEGLALLRPLDPAPPVKLIGHGALVRCARWSPDGGRLASASNDGTARIWDTTTGTELARFALPDNRDFARVAWSPDGRMIATAHPEGTFCLWDAGASPDTGALPTAVEAPPSLAHLPAALALMLRLGISAPLSTVRAILALTGPGVDTAYLPDGARALCEHRGVRALAALRWPLPARLSFLLLLLKGYHDPEFALPPNVTSTAVRMAFLDSLGGLECAPDAPPLPLAFLDRSLAAVDDRLLTLLRALGEKACADHPELPLSFLPRLANIPPLTAADRALLSIRTPMHHEGRALGRGAGAELSGVSNHGGLSHLVPWQWALPPALRRLRASDGTLLFRAHAGREAPRLRPTILVVDTSAGCFGPVDALVRTAALAAANALLAAELPAYVVAAGGETRTWALQTKADAVEILAERSPAAARPKKALARAKRLAEVVRDGVMEPVVLVFSHPWFGAEEDSLLLPGCLRGLFVMYPRHPATPALASRCDRWRGLRSEDHEGLSEAVVELLG